MQINSSNNSEGSRVEERSEYGRRPAGFAELSERHRLLGRLLRGLIAVALFLLLLNLILHNLLPGNEYSLPLHPRNFIQGAISPGGDSLLLLAAPQGEHGGTIMTSTDGGEAWEERYTADSGIALNAFEMDWRSGGAIAVGDGGRLLLSFDFWEHYSSEIVADTIKAMWDVTLDWSSGIAVTQSDNFELWRSETSTRNWRPVLNSPELFMALPPIVASSDGYLRFDWPKQRGFFAPVNSGWLDFGQLDNWYHTTDGGRTWNLSRLSSSSADSNGDEQQSAATAKLKDSATKPFESQRDFEDSQRSSQLVPPKIQELAFVGLDAASGKGLAFSAKQFYVSDDYGASWTVERTDTAPAEMLSSGIAAGDIDSVGNVLVISRQRYAFRYDSLGNVRRHFDDSRVYRASDWGRQWRRDTLANFSAGRNVLTHVDWNGSHGLLVGRQGGIWRLDGFNADWQPLIPYRLERGPEFAAILSSVLHILLWVVFGTAIALLYWRGFLRRKLNAIRQAPELQESSLAIMADNPSLDDKLGFGPTVDAIVALLRNPDTRPPVSLVVSGPWGSGKSSLMAQVRARLERNSGRKTLASRWREIFRRRPEQFMTLWFNVWHFQSEKHLLAVFLSNIIEMFERHFSFRFRLRLFWIRAARLKFPEALRFWFAVFVLLPLVIYAFLQLHLPFGIQISLADLPLLHPLTIALDHLFEVVLSGFEFATNPIGSLGMGAAVVLWLLSLFSLTSTASASGLATFLELIPMDKFRHAVLTDDPGFREQYKREFWDIMAAAGPNARVGIFIDDLDRVSGDKIRTLLEGINFIADTASKPSDLSIEESKIYFLIGMAPEEVVKSLDGALGEAEPEDSPEDATSDIRKPSRGARFLEKMIDLIVRVPSIKSEPDKLVHLMLREEEQGSYHNAKDSSQVTEQAVESPE